MQYLIYSAEFLDAINEAGLLYSYFAVKHFKLILTFSDPDNLHLTRINQKNSDKRSTQI